MNNNNVFVEHYATFCGRRYKDHKTISQVVGIGHECVYVKNRSHTGTKKIKQEDLIRLVVHG